MFDLFDKRFVINTGKGGVGKTTISAAIALAAARRGKRVLLMDMSAKERFSRMFGSAPLTVEPAEVEENLFALRITPDEALEEYAIMKLKLKTLYKAVFENRFIRTFLKVIPGINELTLLGKAWYEEQAREGGRPRWDMIVVDAPATGHGGFFLQIPDVISSIVSSGPLFNEAQQISDLVHDPKRTALNLITLVEEMPVNETIELKHRVDTDLKVPLGYVVANAVYPPLFDDPEALDAVRAAIPDDDSELDQLLDAASFRHRRVTLQRTYLDRIDNEVDLPQIRVPYYFTERFNFMTISKIADQIDRQARGHAQSREAGRAAVAAALDADAPA